MQATWKPMSLREIRQHFLPIENHTSEAERSLLDDIEKIRQTHFTKDGETILHTLVRESHQIRNATLLPPNSELPSTTLQSITNAIGKILKSPSTSKDNLQYWVNFINTRSPEGLTYEELDAELKTPKISNELLQSIILTLTYKDIKNFPNNFLNSPLLFNQVLQARTLDNNETLLHILARLSHLLPSSKIVCENLRFIEKFILQKLTSSDNDSSLLYAFFTAKNRDGQSYTELEFQLDRQNLAKIKEPMLSIYSDHLLSGAVEDEEKETLLQSLNYRFNIAKIKVATSFESQPSSPILEEPIAVPASFIGKALPAEKMLNLLRQEVGNFTDCDLNYFVETGQQTDIGEVYEGDTILHLAARQYIKDPSKRDRVEFFIHFADKNLLNGGKEFLLKKNSKGNLFYEIENLSPMHRMHFFYLASEIIEKG